MKSNLSLYGAISWAILCIVAAFDPLSAAAQTSCDGSDNNPPEISAIYLDNFSGWHAVGKEAWVSVLADGQLIFSLCSVDNNKKYLIARNSDSNDFNPGKFSRFEWFGSNGQLFYCQQVFDAASAADAANFTATPAADTSDPNDKGCGAGGQFAWSQLALLRR